MSSLRFFLLSLIIILCVLLQRLYVNCAEDVTAAKGDLDDIIVDFINGSYIDEDTFDLSVNYKNNGNSITIRIDVINEFPPQIFMRMKVWGRAFGQYKLPTGLSLDVNICDGKLKKYFLESILSTIGVDMSHCPPKPGSYGIEDYVAKMDGLPTYSLPSLNFLIDTELYSPPDISIMKLKIYNHVF